MTIVPVIVLGIIAQMASEAFFQNDDSALSCFRSKSGLLVRTEDMLLMRTYKRREEEGREERGEKRGERKKEKRRGERGEK
jgi:hypothetical protein